MQRMGLIKAKDDSMEWLTPYKIESPSITIYTNQTVNRLLLGTLWFAKCVPRLFKPPPEC
jgi:hypothetical protein